LGRAGNSVRDSILKDGLSTGSELREGDSFEWLVLVALGNQAQRLLGLVKGAFLFAAKHVVAKDAEEIGN